MFLAVLGRRLLQHHRLIGNEKMVNIFESLKKTTEVKKSLIEGQVPELVKKGRTIEELQKESGTLYFSYIVASRKVLDNRAERLGRGIVKTEKKLKELEERRATRENAKKMDILRKEQRELIAELEEVEGKLTEVENALGYAKKIMTPENIRALESLIVNNDDLIEYAGYFRKAKNEGNYARMMLVYTMVCLDKYSAQEFKNNRNKLEDMLANIEKLSISLSELKKQIEQKGAIVKPGEKIALEYGIILIPENGEPEGFRKTFDADRIRYANNEKKTPESYHVHAGVDQFPYDVKVGSSDRLQVKYHTAPVTGIVLHVDNVTTGGYTGKQITILGVDGVVYFTCHHEEIFVKAGDAVRGGQVIAEIGKTGVSKSGKHIHFGMRTEINPVSYKTAITSEKEIPRAKKSLLSKMRKEGKIIDPIPALEQVYREMGNDECSYLMSQYIPPKSNKGKIR